MHLKRTGRRRPEAQPPNPISRVSSERERLRSEIADMRGLMHLLMKQRNGYRWTEGDRRKIRAHLRKLASLSPYMVLFVSPGGFLALPVLAWWLDRRRQKRTMSEQPATE